MCALQSISKKGADVNTYFYKRCLIYVLAGILSLQCSFTFYGSSLAATPKTYTNSIGMEFTLIPAGSFMMGAHPVFDQGFKFDQAAKADESPQHKVTITKPFYLGIYEVTQEQWVAVMGSNPSSNVGRNNPVEQVSSYDIQEFINRLNKMEGHNRYRLPTEAEWEYAARAGTTTNYFFGDDIEKLGDYAWYRDNSDIKTHPVGQKLPNPWGLYDILGNARELVQDWYGETYYQESPEKDPQGPSSGEFRVYRGGSICGWFFPHRVAYRWRNPPERRHFNFGFRLAMEVKD